MCRARWTLRRRTKWIRSFSSVVRFPSAAFHHEGTKGTNELWGSHPELEVNFSTAQPEEILIQFGDSFIYDNLSTQLFASGTLLALYVHSQDVNFKQVYIKIYKSISFTRCILHSHSWLQTIYLSAIAIMHLLLCNWRRTIYSLATATCNHMAGVEPFSRGTGKAK